jgi:hypothetical protein
MLAADRDNIGAVATAKNALSFICALNDISTAQYTSVRVNAALEAMRRQHKHQIRKAAGITPNMVKAIMDAYGHFRRDGRPQQQWELAIGAAIAIGFKLLLRYGDLSRCRWVEGFCEVFPTHVRFYLDGRKNDMYGGNFQDVAAPAEHNESGVYHLCVGRGARSL